MKVQAAFFCNVSDPEGGGKKMGDNLRGSLDKVTNVEAFQGVADQQVGGTISTLLRFLEVSALDQKRLRGVFSAKDGLIESVAEIL